MTLVTADVPEEIIPSIIRVTRIFEAGKSSAFSITPNVVPISKFFSP
jgi:hypothetical protein